MAHVGVVANIWLASSQGLLSGLAVNVDVMHFIAFILFSYEKV